MCVSQWLMATVPILVLFHFNYNQSYNTANHFCLRVLIPFTVSCNIMSTCHSFCVIHTVICLHHTVVYNLRSLDIFRQTYLLYMIRSRYGAQKAQRVSCTKFLTPINGNNYAAYILKIMDMAYNVCRKLFQKKCRLYPKLRLYNTVIGPEILYAAEALIIN